MTEKRTVRKFLTRKSRKRKRSKSPGQQQQQQPSGDDAPMEWCHEQEIHNEDEAMMPEEGIEERSAVPNYVESAEVQQQINEQPLGGAPTQLSQNATGMSQLNPFHLNVNILSNYSSPLGNLDGGITTSPDGDDTNHHQTIERLEQLLMQKDVTIQQQSDELQSTRLELQTSRKQCQKHKQRAYDVQQKFLRWDKLLKEWMARNRSRPMEEWDERPPDSAVAMADVSVSYKPAGVTTSSSKASHKPVAFTEPAVVRATTSSTTAAIQRPAAPQYQPRSEASNVPIQQRIAQVNVNQSCSTPPASVAPATPRVMSGAASSSSTQSRLKKAATTKTAKEPAKESRQETKQSTTENVKAIHPKEMIIFDEQLVASGGKAISRSGDKPSLRQKKITISDEQSVASGGKAISRGDDKPSSKPNRKELQNVARDKPPFTPKPPATKQKLSSIESLATTAKNKENQHPNMLQNRQKELRRVTMTPKQQPKGATRSPFSQNSPEGSQTQLDPRASVWNHGAPDTYDVASDKAIPTATGKTAKFVQNDVNDEDVLLNSMPANDSMTQGRSQALLGGLSSAGTTKTTEQAPTATNENDKGGTRKANPPNRKTVATSAKDPPPSRDMKSYSVVKAIDGWISNVASRTFVDEAFTANQLANQKLKLKQQQKSPISRGTVVNPYKKARQTANESDSKSPAAKLPVKSTKAADTTWLQRKNPSACNRYYAAGDDDDDDESQLPGYKHVAVVRGKQKRSCLPGHACAECDPFWNAVCEGNTVFERKQFQDLSRHRAAFSPENTPPDFWELSFVDERRQREEQERQAVAIHKGCGKQQDQEQQAKEEQSTTNNDVPASAGEVSQTF
jgi:hypothetical protein